MNNALTGLIALVVIIGAVVLWFVFGNPTPVGNNGQATTTNGSPVAEVKREGALSDKVTVNTPLPGASVSKSFTIIGTAPGNWHFEASFPVEIRDMAGNVIFQHYAEAQEEWMTTDIIPFKSEVAITSAYTGPATLILRKDNPSGLPENDASVSIPITIQ